SISSSLALLLHWRISHGTAPFLGTGQQPILVEACCGLASERARSGGVLPEARSLDDKLDAMGTPSGERGRSAQTCRTSAEFASESVETAAEKSALEAPKEASALSLRRAPGQRADCASGVLEHACRSDELQRHGAFRICRGVRSLAAFAAHLARSTGTIRQRNGLAKPASSECPGAIKQRC